MKRSFPVVDADGHMIERIASWENFSAGAVSGRGKEATPKSKAAQDLER